MITLDTKELLTNDSSEIYAFATKMLSIWGVFGGFILWAWTFLDVIKDKTMPKKKKRLWIVSMFLVAYISNIFYFFFVYLPRARSNS